MASFLENFTEESTNVQLMLLTSTVKLFLARPSEAQDLVLKNLKIATEGENPDVRDRAYIYWRLLSTDSQATQVINLYELYSP
jgi:vesicle coat complex subunit